VRSCGPISIAAWIFLATAGDEETRAPTWGGLAEGVIRHVHYYASTADYAYANLPYIKPLTLSRLTDPRGVAVFSCA
jgi:hypothetical protein